MIPVNESLLYIRPLYLQSSEGRIPELKQVIVAYQSRIEMAETLTRALSRIFGPVVAAALAPDRLASSATSVVATVSGGRGRTPGAAETPAGAVNPTVASLVAQMRRHFDAADKALRNGDLAAYADEMKKAAAVARSGSRR